jgi:hypothetical protein
MSHEEPIMSNEESAIRDTRAQNTAVQAQETAAYEPIEREDEWLDEPTELPRRPRRRLLTPIPIALLGVLLIACGFIGGVLVEKGQTSTSSGSSAATASLTSRFAALRGGASSTGTRSGTTSGTSGGLPGSGAGGGLVAGQVAYFSGSTLYVTNAEGNTVKVTTSAGTSVSKTVKGSVKGIHPGETVAVTGATGKNGTVSAESIRVGSSGGGLAALFGGSSSGSGSGTSGGNRSGAGGGPALFGNGG